MKFKKQPRKIMLDYYKPLKNLFKNEDIEKYTDWYEFRKQWDLEPCIIIIPVGVLPLIGLDIRFVFREFGRNNNVRFLLIGTSKQIEFVLSQNDGFLGNIVEQVTFPMDVDVVELAILKKIDSLIKQTKGKK